MAEELELGLIYVDAQGTFKRIPLEDASETMGDVAARVLDVEHICIEDQNGRWRQRFLLITSEERYAPNDLDLNPVMELLYSLPGPSFSTAFQWEALVLGRYRRRGASSALEYAFTREEMDKLEQHFGRIMRNIELQRAYSKLEDAMASGDEAPKEPDYEEEELDGFEPLVKDKDSSDDSSDSSDDSSDSSDDSEDDDGRVPPTKRAREESAEGEPEKKKKKKKTRFLFIGHSHEDTTKYIEEVQFDDADDATDLYQLSDEDMCTFLRMAADCAPRFEKPSDTVLGRLLKVLEKGKCDWDDHERAEGSLGAFENVFSYDYKKE
jgi:hypothetical protein